MKVSTIIGVIVVSLHVLSKIPKSEAQSNLVGWSTWISSKCSVTCGKGKIARTRICLSRKCKGKSKSTKDCNAGSCKKWSGWSDFTPCDATCGKGKKTRTRKCIGGRRCKGKRSNTVSCNEGSCPVLVDEREWSEWGDFTPCDVTCGKGKKTRTRKCIGGKRCKGKSTNTVSCKEGACSTLVDELGFTQWSKFSKCSVSCDGGIQSRTRQCTTANCNGHLREIHNCRERTCSRTSTCKDKMPSSRCKALKKACKNRGVSRNCQLTCNKCPKIQTWSEYGPCSNECGAGLKTRTKGKKRQSITCFGTDCISSPTVPDPVYSWGPWTDAECSKTCGGGTQNRKRTCSSPNKCSGSDAETLPCQTDECPKPIEWADWSRWTKCTKTCGGGSKYRARTCAVDEGCEALRGERQQEAICNEQSCPSWRDWSAWSACQVTCGGGTITRQRACSISGKCLGEASQTTNCMTNPCAEWTEWSLWGDCSKSCGGGTRSRQRGCSIEGACDILGGSKQDTEYCNEYPCSPAEEPPSDTWSDCSKSCGEGTRNIRNCTSGTCIQEFEGCNDGDCPAVSCSSEHIFHANRYGSKHECCNKARSIQDASCGKVVPTSGRRIIGGDDAAEGQWPWIVAVQMSSGFCAGSIISENFILSAAHCFAYDSGQPKNTTHWRIISGVLSLTALASSKLHEIEKSYIHPDYSFPTADIALVKLKKNLHFGNIQPICLPWGEKTKFDSTCYVTGWGVSTIPNAVTTDLQELGILNFDPRACVHAYGKHEGLKRHVSFLESNRGYLCAGSLTRPIDSCSGDSGGPLVCQRCNSCTWYIAGIVSFGPNPCAMIGVPGVYSNVLYYEDWILKITGMPKHSSSCPDN